MIKTKARIKHKDSHSLFLSSFTLSPLYNRAYG